ncbi:hypothetical protein QVD17_06878 [Tagetes erecta]|uniref:CCHC-type domain-containing protein n=1 Tax=Tagetes erecta TaxID=13708 RepID=A0AAD8LMN1_TARER|nr:hypothetical protein QVD17_06878 [Tagetes erecta]
MICGSLLTKVLIPTQINHDSASTYTKDSTEPYPEDNLQGEDLRKVKNDSKAYSLMCKGLPLQVLSRLDAYQTGYTLFKALKSICEGGEQLRSLKKQKLKRQLELFEHIARESTIVCSSILMETNSDFSEAYRKVSMDLDLLIAKIEEVEIDESSRNTDRSSSHAQYKFVVNPSNTVENAFLIQDAVKTDDEGDLFVGASFYTDSSYQLSSPIYSQPQSPSRVQVQPMKSQAENQSSSSTVQAKVKDVMNILLQDDETKNAFTAFMASFQAYQGSHLTQLDVLQDLFEMDPDDVEEMDLNWQMVMVAYRTQKHAYVNRSYKPNANKTVGFDKSKARCFNCNCYGHFSRECKAPKNLNYNGQASSSGQNQKQGKSQNSQQSSSYQNINQLFIQKPYQSLPMPELKDEADLTSSLALVCEIEEEVWSEEGDCQVVNEISEDSEDYDWSAKSDPTDESESEIALMATSEESFSSAESNQPKVSIELPPNYVPLPDDVKESWNKTLKELELSNKQLEEMTKNFELEKIAHAATKVELTKMESSKAILAKSKSESERSEVLIESLKEDDSMTIEADDEASNKSDPILVQLVEYPELNPKPAETVKDDAEFSGYNDPEYIKWKKEQKVRVADQLIKQETVKKTEVSKAKVQKPKLSNNQSEMKQSKGKNVIISNDNTKAQVVKTETVKPVTKKVSKIKPIKFVSAGTFYMNSSHGNQINSKIKSNYGLKSGSGPKTSAVNDKRFESKKVTKQDVSKSNQVPKQPKFDNKKSKSQPQSPQKNKLNFKTKGFVNETRVGSTSKVNSRLFKISKKHCEICDRYNHATAECFFTRFKEMSSRNQQVNSFTPRALMVRNQRFENNLDPKLEERCALEDLSTRDAGGKITGEGTVSNGIISFDKVNYCAQLNFNFLSVSQICDKSYSTLFDDSLCYILKPGFKIDNEWVVVKAPRDRDVYKLYMSQIDAETETTCLIAHASNDESQLWHRRLGHSNFRNMNKLVTGNHAVGIPSKKFSTTDLCPAYLKGKQH